MSLQISPYQAQAVGKCIVWGFKKCWEWTKQEEKEHREKEEYEKIYSRLKEQQKERTENILKQLKERQEIAKQKLKEKQDKEAEEEEADDKEKVLKILENIDIDDIIREFQIKN
jgi:hypothetical protein